MQDIWQKKRVTGIYEEAITWLEQIILLQNSKGLKKIRKTNMAYLISLQKYMNP